MSQNDDSKQSVKKRGLFAYAPNLPIPVRVVALLLFAGGVIFVLSGLVMFWAGLTGYSSAQVLGMIFLLLGIFLLALWNGLGRMKKWALYASVLLVFAFPIGTLCFVIILVNHKKFS